MNDEPIVSSDAGCLGTLVSVSVVSVILTAGLIQNRDQIGMVVPVFFVVTIIFVCFGLPLFLLVQRFRWETLSVAIACGGLTGAAVPVIGALSDGTRGSWLAAVAYALAGAVGGLVFFLTGTASRNPTRHITLLISTASAATALAPPVSRWLFSFA